jgi:hypothetical protein
MQALGEAAREPLRAYLTGGATAVLLGWRDATIDLDFLLEPNRDGILGSIPALKERLELNLEPSSPQDFLPETEGWRERARFERQCGTVAFYHYDLVAQALSKLERGHAKDLDDVRAMLDRGLVDPAALATRFAEIEKVIETDPRWAAIDLASFRATLESELRGRDLRSEATD